MPPQVGQIVQGKYRLVRLIGEGGMGSVYEARHEYLGSTVALKFLNEDLSENHALVQRFLQEGRVSASIRSPHVVKVSDVDQTPEGVPYLVMELLVGQSLSSILQKKRPLSRDKALDFGVQILNGLAAAHAFGVVHRDLKPDNVFVVPMGRGQLVKLLDFGIAKLKLSDEVRKGLTAPGVFMGTPAYMAPEQMFSASTADPRSDLFALSVMLYEMLSGRRPFVGDDPQLVAAAIIAKDYPDLHRLNPQISAELASVVTRSLAPEPADRFASAVEYRHALLNFFQPSVFASGVVTMQQQEADPDMMQTPLASLGDSSERATAGNTVPEGPAGGNDGALPSTRPMPIEVTATDENGISGRPAPGASTGTVVGDVPSPGLFDGAAAGIGPTANAQPLPSTQPDVAAAPAPVPRGRTRAKSSAWKWVLGTLLLLVVAAAATIVGILRPWEPERLPPELPVIPTASSTVTMDSGFGPEEVDAGQQEPLPPTTTTTHRPDHPPSNHTKRDAGHGQPPLPSIPSNLPPLPSNLPPLPSTLPPLPSGFPPIQIPGWPPANNNNK